MKWGREGDGLAWARGSNIHLGVKYEDKILILLKGMLECLGRWRMWNEETDCISIKELNLN